MNGINKNEKNGMWKGNNAGLGAIHVWIKNNKPKPKLCEECTIKNPIDLANISQKYKRDINDFEWLCRRCHMIKDGRLKKLIITSRNRRNPEKSCIVCGKVFHSSHKKATHCSLSCNAYTGNKKRWHKELI